MAPLSQFESRILAAVDDPGYQPVKPRALARKLGLASTAYPDFKNALRDLVQQGRLTLGKGQMVRAARPTGAIAGTFRRTSSGAGFVRVTTGPEVAGGDIFISGADTLDAANGDEVLVRLKSKAARSGRNRQGVILRILARETRQFVGTYFEREGASHVRIDGSVFAHSIVIGDAGAHTPKSGDKVVVEMLHFPTADGPGEGVIVEVLGRPTDPGVDVLSIIRQFELPDRFADDALEEARAAALDFNEETLAGRADLTAQTTVTIDPADAKDFDDAISLEHDERSKHWRLSVHIADVAHFVPAGGALDREARRRGTSVYLPGRVLPMLPELISNGLASLQQGKVRYVKTVHIDFTPTGQRAHIEFAQAAIRVSRRLRYEEVGDFLEGRPSPAADSASVSELLLRMRDLALILRKRRRKHGALELTMPEAELELDDKGAVRGAHLRKQDLSHQIIEEFMLAANEAVAEHLAGLGVSFLRRIHPAPEPNRLEVFAEFARGLGYKIVKRLDRFTLQRVLDQAAKRPDSQAVNYALLRSLKQAVYSPEEEEHYALASSNYCHFTSPIRRYPDLTVHRQLGQWLKTGNAGSDEIELVQMGAHCSKTERRAERAERELIKLKLLTFMNKRIGSDWRAIITGVADYGFFAQLEELPVEGMVHISTLEDDYYHFDEAGMTLQGRRAKKRYRLGDRIKVRVVRVDLQRRQMDFRVVE
jgi:ribonuclease R